MLFRRREAESCLERVRVHLWPRRSFSRSGRYVVYRLRRLSKSPHAVALGFAVGVFSALTPFLGTHMVMAALIAWIVGGSIVAAILGTFLGNPLTYPLLWYSTYEVGNLMLGGQVGASHRSLQRHFPVLAREAVADPEADDARLHPRRSCSRRVELCPRQADGRGLPASPPPRARAQIARGSRRPMTKRLRPNRATGRARRRSASASTSITSRRSAMREEGEIPIPCARRKLAVEAGADNITAHLREDRRHITDEDIARLMAAKLAPLNLEMAVTDEMLSIALRVKPHASCLVPERRKEITTEGGLDVAGQLDTLAPVRREARRAGIQVSLFIDPEPEQIEASPRSGLTRSSSTPGPIAWRDQGRQAAERARTQAPRRRRTPGRRSRPRSPCRTWARL